MNVDSVELGSLTCQTVDAIPAGCGPELVVVLCHGYGAPGTDLVPIAGEVFALEPKLSERVRFIFPAAPHALDMVGLFGGRAWWDIDMDRLVTASEQGLLHELTGETPDGIAEARGALRGAIDAAVDQTELPISRLVLGGFSQGAILATDLTLRLDESPAALCIFSGMLISRSDWQEFAPRHAGLKVFQSHGRQDPILRYEGATPLKDLLETAGLSVEFVPFNGPHTIPGEGIHGLRSLITNALPA